MDNPAAFKHYNCKEIYQKRLGLKMSRKQLASYVGVTSQTIANVEEEKFYTTPLLISLTVVLDYLSIKACVK